MIHLRKSQTETLDIIRSIAPATTHSLCMRLYGRAEPILIKQAGAKLSLLAQLGLVHPVGHGARREGTARGTTPILWAVSDEPHVKPSPRRYTPAPAPGRDAALLALSEPMTRHTLADRLGCSYDSAAQYVAQLQAARKIEPCGTESGQNGKWWRTQFRAIGGKA